MSNLCVCTYMHDVLCCTLQADCPKDKLEELFGSFDTFDHGVITEAEFLAFFRKMRSMAQKNRYEAAAALQMKAEAPTTPVFAPTTPV